MPKTKRELSSRIAVLGEENRVAEYCNSVSLRLNFRGQKRLQKGLRTVKAMKDNLMAAKASVIRLEAQ